MKIDDFEKHHGEKVWCYCINEPKRLITPTLALLEWNKSYHNRIILYKLSKTGVATRKAISYRSSYKWKPLEVFTDKQECIDAFNEECRVIIDKYNQLIQQTNNL